MAERSIEDRLREEYFDLLPRMTRVAQSLTTEIEYALRLLRKELAPHENLVVKTRVKECVSAIDKLRRRNPGAVFDRDQPQVYSLLHGIRDLVGVRVLVFPSKRAVQVDRALRAKYQSWQSDPIFAGDTQIAYKYHGLRFHDRVPIPCEYQIVSTLIGLFWETEHSAIYKQSPSLRGIEPLMKEQTLAVYEALKSFEDEFERHLERSELGLS